MMTSADIRQAFMDFFRSKGHTIVPSAPIVVKDDPTLMFTNAGMNQFKDFFLGNKLPEYGRVADTQKCLRVSGKHNDLEEVGVDTYHHTMFEMLGNWSFGDYFKKEAISWSWELLTEVYKLDKSRLYVTIFEGDEKEGLPKDEEAYNEWSKYISKDRILPGNKKDNFWEMGDTGPCGPCTEIHYDTRPEANNDGHALVNNDDTGMVMEIWNNVFIQFERYWNPKFGGANELREWEEENIKLYLSANKDEQKKFKEGRAEKHRELTLLKDLPAKHVDTGMGLERLVRVVQNRHSNYDTDVFFGTLNEIVRITNEEYHGGDKKSDIAFRVIADHIRAISFTIADGQLPSNTGAGYVIRRILRRAVRYYYSYLNYKLPLLTQLVPLLAKQFEDVFPELHKQLDFVSKVIREEEEAFLRTLEKGIDRFYKAVTSSIESESRFEEFFKKNKIAYKRRKEVFVNNQRYEADFFLPELEKYLEVTLSISVEKKVYPVENVIEINTVDIVTVALPKVKELLRSELKNTKLDFTPLTILSGKTAFELYDTFGFPLDLTTLIAKEHNFSVDEKGFHEEMQLQKSRSRAATALEAEDWVMVGPPSSSQSIAPTHKTLELEVELTKYRKISTKGKTLYQFVFVLTPFYPEAGGQIGDRGVMIFGDEIVEVIDTKKENDLVVHFTEKLPSNLQGKVILRVNKTLRKEITVHHSATHLMHAAFRKVLGTHVAQKGSLVNEEGLRFDFSHFAKVTAEEIAAVEALVNKKIRENIKVEINEMKKDEAIALGAMALFGEKYGDVVRVVIMDPNYSVELCGGTHVGATGELGLFKITGETAVAAGVRRVEAVCGKQAEDFINEKLGLIDALKETLKSPKDLQKSVENLQQENAELKKHLELMEARQLVGIRNELLQKDEIINGVNFVGDIVEVSNPDALKKLCFDLKNHLRDHVAVLCVNLGGKPFVAVGISETVAAAKKLDAGKIIKEQVAPLIKGGGGGQKTLATAGGQDAGQLPKVIETVKKLLSV